jgi:8-oxo-dGTP pyrophosphatase MutT (NUDIX family)
MTKQRTEKYMTSENTGAIAIIYKVNDGIISYLLTTQKSGMINFVGGGRETSDATIEETIKREIAEETTLAEPDYELATTELTHEFTYIVKKEGRTGKDWENTVFIAKVSPDIVIQPRGEIVGLSWYDADRAISSLRFDDMKEVFKKAITIIKEKNVRK